jgi:DNA-binding NarL/FixJ family response regulator
VHTTVSVKVAIVEDNAGVRENWAKLINTEPGFACVGAYETGEAALKRLPGCRPDVVLMDINLPGMSGIECTARLKAKMPETQILMVTVYADNEHVFEALKVGASGYLLKCTEPSELTRSIAEVTRGGAPMTGQIARQVIAAFRRPTVEVVAEAQLTHREEEILERLAQGFGNKEIAARLGTSVETVRTQVRHIYEKLHVHSRTEAAAKYLAGAERGLGLAASAR